MSNKQITHTVEDSSLASAPQPAGSVQSASALQGDWCTRIVLAVTGLVGILLILYGTYPHGAGLSPDSVNYIAAAQSLLEGNGLQRANGVPFVSWPPLFPIMLAGFGLTGLDLFLAARVLNALVFGGIIVASGMLFAQHVRSRLLILLGAAAILVSTPLQLVSAFAWSEPLFMPWCVVAILCLTNWLRYPSVAILGAAAVATALACLTRYLGITMILTGLIAILLHRQLRLWDKLWSAGLFGAISGLPLALWLARNYTITAHLTGSRSPSTLAWDEAVDRAARILGEWFLAPSLGVWLRVGIAGLLLLGLLARWLVPLAARPTTSVQALPTVPFAFAVVYALGLIMLSLRIVFVAIDANPRFLAPVYPVVICLILWLLQSLCDGAAAIFSRRVPWSLLVALLLAGWLIYPPARQSHAQLLNWRTNGTGGYATPAWQSAPLMQYLRKNPPHGRILCNSPDGLWAATRLRSDWSPARRISNLSAWADQLATDQPTYLVWTGKRARYLHHLTTLKAHLHLDPVLELPDGGVYLIRTDEASDLSHDLQPR